MYEMYEFPFIFTSNTTDNGGFLFAPSEWNGMLPPNAEKKQVLLGGKKQEMFVVPEIEIIPIATDFKYSFLFSDDREAVLLSRKINGLDLNMPQIDCTNFVGRNRSQMNVVGALVTEEGLFICRLIGSAKKQSQNLMGIMRNLRFNLSNRRLDDQLALLKLYIDPEPETVTAVNSTESSLVFSIKARPFDVNTDLFNPEGKQKEQMDYIKDNIVCFYQHLIDENRPPPVISHQDASNTSMKIAS